jgi:hypothetical protein
MNELLQSYAEKALVWLEQGAAFIQGEVPVYIEELLKWKAANAIVWLVLGFVLLVFGIIMCIVGFKRLAKSDFSDEVCQIIGTITLVCSIPFIMYNTLKLLQITLAPRVYLVEYLMDIIN